MNYRGRILDPIALWGEIVDFPPSVPDGGFAPLVRCPNPEHYTDKKHFQVNLDRPLVHCFANCGISGSYEKAIALVKGVTEREARKIIVRHTRIEAGPRSKRKVRLPDGRMRSSDRRSEKEVSRDALEFETYIPAVGLEYLEARGIGSESIAAFGLGWDRDDRRIAIPARDIRGVTRFLIKRAVREKDWPKYLYTEGSDKTSLLFGACNIDREQVESQGLVLVEGSLDVLRRHSNGARNTTGILGSYLSRRQVEIISRLNPPRIYAMLDKDVAGVRALMALARMVRKTPIFVCLYPRGKSDPGELTRKEDERAIERAVPYVTFQNRIPETLRHKEVARVG